MDKEGIYPCVKIPEEMGGIAKNEEAVVPTEVTRDSGWPEPQEIPHKEKLLP